MIEYDDILEAYHHKQCKYTGDTYEFLQGNHTWFVTAIWQDNPEVDLYKFALMRDDYSLPDNPAWYTFDLTLEEIVNITNDLQVI